jgi:hypothetical protein
MPPLSSGIELFGPELTSHRSAAMEETEPKQDTHFYFAFSGFKII